MSDKSQVRSRRNGVVTNYFGVTLAATVFCLGEYGTWNWIFGILLIIGLALVRISFSRTYLKTGIMSLVRSRAEDLDEREIQVTHEAYRRSYRVFTAVSLLFVVFILFSVRFSFATLTWRGHYSFGLMVMIVLNYMVYTLPASAVAWREKCTPAGS